MIEHTANPVDSFENLKDRVERFVGGSVRHAYSPNQLAFEFVLNRDEQVISPKESVAEFLNFFTDALPGGDVYLFGGVLRDLALLGKRGFYSDIDLVVEGDWNHCIPYLHSLAARRNKFGGYRLEVGGWPIDIWNAKDTWAIRQGWVRYRDISSLTQTTILNWDAILMNWRNRTFIYREGYLNALTSRLLDVVLEKNPNPLGMAVRVFRHLSIKDAKKITPLAAEYLANCTAEYRFEELQNRELRSYGNSAISRLLYSFFSRLKVYERLEVKERFEIASKSLNNEGLAIPRAQTEWMFDDMLQR